MKNRLIALFALLGMLGGTVSLQAQSAPSAHDKIGVINIQAAIANSAEGKKVIADLQRKYHPRQQELQRLQQEIQAIQDQLSKQAATLSEDEQRRLSRELEDKQRIMKRSADDAQSDYNADTEEAVSRIGQKLVRVIGDYAQQNGFVLVIDGAQIPIYYAAKDIEISADIVKRYDAANPLPAAAGAPKPAVPHP